VSLSTWIKPSGVLNHTLGNISFTRALIAVLKSTVSSRMWFSNAKLYIEVLVTKCSLERGEQETGPRSSRHVHFSSFDLPTAACISISPVWQQINPCHVLPKSSPSSRCNAAVRTFWPREAADSQVRNIAQQHRASSATNSVATQLYSSAPNCSLLFSNGRTLTSITRVGTD